MRDGPVVVEDHGSVRVIRLNRPEKLNAVDTALAEAICAALDAADADKDIRAIILGATGRAFCAGADIHEFKNPPPDLAERLARRAELSLRLHGTVPRMAKPVVAAVHGAAVGGGAALALSCDMIVVADNVRFGFTELRHGLVPALAMPALQRHFGRKLGFELMTTGRMLGAEELVAMRIASRAVTESQQEAAAREIAETWSALDPSALAASKRLFHRVGDLPYQEALEAGRAVNAAVRTAVGR